MDEFVQSKRYNKNKKDELYIYVYIDICGEDGVETNRARTGESRDPRHTALVAALPKPFFQPAIEKVNRTAESEYILHKLYIYSYDESAFSFRCLCSVCFVAVALLCSIEHPTRIFFFSSHVFSYGLCIYVLSKITGSGNAQDGRPTISWYKYRVHIQ